MAPSADISLAALRSPPACAADRVSAGIEGVRVSAEAECEDMAAIIAMDAEDEA
jgi:hypothetical protein